MTPQEEAAIRLAIQQIVHEAMDDGIRAAVQMMRMSKTLQPGMTIDQLANAIESTIETSPDERTEIDFSQLG